MLLPMLKAVSKMLSPPLSTGTAVPEVRVADAKIILEEIIKSLESPTITLCPSVGTWTSTENQNPVSKTKPGEKPLLEPKTRPEPVPTVETKDEWMITIDENRGLKIVDFPMDGMVELDGKKMKYSEARGQKFTKARIL